MNRLFEQTGGIGLDLTALRGSLARQRRLNLGADVNGDNLIDAAFQPYPPYRAKHPSVKRHARLALQVGVLGNLFPSFRERYSQKCGPSRPRSPLVGNWSLQSELADFGGMPS